MQTQTIDLYATFGVDRAGNTGGYLDVFCRTRNAENAKKLRPAILVVAGGGYNMISFREGEPVALKFVAVGYAAFLLRYSTRTAYPVPLVEAAMAMAYIRKNADCYDVDADHVCAAGFSAGGHLVGLLATHFRDRAIADALGGEHVRPDAVILGYPVATMGEYTHGETRDYITGKDPALVPFLSVENSVTKESAPAFLWHTMEDPAVPVENSLMTAMAYRRAGVPFEMHIFEKGWHGLSTGELELNDSAEAAESVSQVRAWVALALTWLRKRGFFLRVR